MTAAVRVPPPDQGSRRYTDLPLDLIRPDPKNPRRRIGDLSDLIAQMRELGLLQAIVVRRVEGEPGYTIVVGHRRYAAAQHLGWTVIPAVVREPMPPVRVLEEMFAENNGRRSLDPIEEAEALRVIFHERRLGSQEQLAIRIGRSLGYVSGRLALLDLPAQEQERVRAGDVNLGTAISTAREVSGRAAAPRSPSPAARGQERRGASPQPPAASAPRPDAVRGAVARALRVEAEYFRRASQQGDPAERRAYEAAADRLEDQARSYGAGEMPLP